MKYTLSVLVENHFGVLARVSGLFSARGYNISSLTVAETEDHAVSNMTIVVDGDERVLDQVKKQLNKLIDVIKVKDLSEQEHVSRELALIKVTADTDNRAEIIQIADEGPIEIYRNLGAAPPNQAANCGQLRGCYLHPIVRQ